VRDAFMGSSIDEPYLPSATCRTGRKGVTDEPPPDEYWTLTR
jgi:hypothetical protein